MNSEPIISKQSESRYKSVFCDGESSNNESRTIDTDVCEGFIEKKKLYFHGLQADAR